MIRKRHLAFAILLVSTIVAATVTLLPSSRAKSSPKLAEGKLFEQALTAIEGNYIDPERISPRKMLDGALSRMQQEIPEILVKEEGSNITVIVGLAKRLFPKGQIHTAADLKKIVHEILSFIAQNYHGDTPLEEIEYAAIDGMLEELDPHSNFMPPKVYKEFQVGTRGEFGGLGIVISIKDGMLTVVAPIEGTPASRAGIRAGDQILQINDESTINMSLTDAVNKMRGDVGTKVAIFTQRAGQAVRKLTLTRALINIDSVQHTLLSEGGRRIGYIKVKSFQANTDEDIRAALKELHEGGKSLDGLILDVRNNPGGLLNASVDFADHFLGEGTIVSTVGPHDQVIEKERAHPKGTQEAYPIILLINEGSASASEIVAGALQANDRAIVMGRRSFGKGSVQTIFELEGGSALKLTIAQYKPAGTQSIQLAGITPDIWLLPVTVDKKAINLVEDISPSEVELEGHLGNSYTTGKGAKGHPRYSIKFLKAHEDEEKEKAVREYLKKPEVENDFEVLLARRLLTTAGSISRREMLERIGTPLLKAKEEQEQAINKALSQVGVDWSTPTQKGSPRLTISYHLRSSGSEIKRAKAGSKIELILSATNTGTSSYSQLIAVGQSDYPFLANREFPFGLISPGTTRTWSIPIELPEELPRQDIAMDVTFEEASGNVPEPLTIIIPVDEFPQPSFAFSLGLKPQAIGRSLATGTPVTLVVDVMNTGTGATSKETIATISNECGDKVFIEKGREKLGVIAPRSSRQAPFRFRLSPGFNESTCELKLTIADIKRMAVLSKKVELLKDMTTIPKTGKSYSPPVIKLETLPPTSTAKERIEINGKIDDTDAIKDYFVFAGKNKIVYAPNPKQTPEMEFAFSVPLEPGTNRIIIGARDQLDLLGRKIIVIERTSGEKKKRKLARDEAMMQGMEP